MPQGTTGTLGSLEASPQADGARATGARAAGAGVIGRRGRAREVGRPPFQVLDRTFAILGVFAESTPEWSTSEIARALELPVPSVHRILSALRRLGYVSQDPQTKRFCLGAGALSLGTRARAVADLRTVALGPLRQLSRQLDETALLTGLSPGRDSSVCLERVESLLPLRLSVEPGHQLPLHAGASQKALLAFMPEVEVRAVLGGELARLCRSTITDPRRLDAELQLTRERGFASSCEETNLGVWGVAVPIVSHADVTCAVGVAGPMARLSNEIVRRTVHLTHAAAAEVAASLAGLVPRLVVSKEIAGLTTETK
ncbi:MAG: IclR family transcriptional regulator [Acidimicrobiales bacterium]